MIFLKKKCRIWPKRSQLILQAIPAMVVLLMLAAPLKSISQQATDSLPPSDTSRIIKIIQAKNWRQITNDTGKVFQVLSGNAVISHENTILSGDSIICDMEAGIAEVFGKIHINDGDSVHTYSQYLRYIGPERKAILKKNVKLTDKKGIIYANDVVYDIRSGMATYTGGGKVVNEKTVLTSTDAVYYSNTNDVYFKRNVQMKDPRYNIISDSLLYNTELKTATFIAPTRIENKDGSTIDTKAGTYNLTSGEAVFYERTAYRDSTRSIIGNKIAYEEKTNTIQIEDNGKVVDSANKVIVIGNQILINKANQTFLATRKPVMIFYSDNDSTYVSADTIYSGMRPADSTITDTAAKPIAGTDSLSVKAADSIRYFLAFHHVRIFNDSLQAVCDSLYYSTADSAFRLYYDPVFWNGDSQVNGDTIYFFTENKQPRLLQVIDNAMVVNRTYEGLFNQAAGRRLSAFFKDGNMDYARISGTPAECVYYPMDEDSAYIGLNRSTGDVIDIFFINKRLDKVKFVNNVDGTLYPLGEAGESLKKLSGFRWMEERRPKNKLELFE